MKTKFTLIIVLSAGIFISSCKKDKDEVTPFNSKYSDLTVEQNKQNLEDEGVEMVNELDQLKSATGIEVAINFANKSESEVVGKSSSITNIVPVNLIASIATSKSYEDVVKSLKTTAEDPETLTDIWDSIVGKYSWDKTTETWAYTALSDKIVFEFPGKEGDTENTASITISNYTFVTISNPDYDIDEEIGTDFPTGLKMELAYNGTVLSSFTYNASFTETGIPTSLEIVLTIDAFSISAKTTHTPYTSASVKYSFKNGDKILIEMYADASGNWSEENIDNNTIETKEFNYIDWTGDSVFSYYTEPVIENILTKGNAYVQVMNIKVAGMIDVKSLGSTMSDLDDQREKESITNKEYYQKMEDAFNKYIQLVVVYADSKEKIAAAIFDGTYEEYSDEYGTSYDFSLDVQFVFADGSKVAAETYFTDGFDGLVDEINNFITDINDEYGDGDIIIDPIEY